MAWPAFFSNRACLPRALATAASIASPPGSGTQVNMTLAVQECKQSLLGSSVPEDFLPDAFYTRCQSFFGADQFLAAPGQFLFHRMADERGW